MPVPNVGVESTIVKQPDFAQRIIVKLSHKRWLPYQANEFFSQRLIALYFTEHQGASYFALSFRYWCQQQ
ncbi:MAG: hypothetical protein AAF327_05525 [Cyanobacteria bacterium P01_A01_bin.37]